MSFKITDVGLIPINWDVEVIENLKDSKRNAIAMGPFGSKIKKEFFQEEGIPVIRGNNLKPFKFNEDNFVYLSDEKAKDMKSSWVFRKDIVITHRGTLGQVGIVPSNSLYEKYIVSQSGMKLTCDKKKVNSNFLYYYLNSRMGQYHLLMNRSQVGVPAIAQASTSLKKIPVPLPELNEQKAIATILSSLDEKIEVNNQINETLENMAQALFKEWFVDFEFPNENGEPYKSSGGEMVESVLGLIPKDWEVNKLDKIINLHDSKRVPLSKNEREKRKGIYPYYGAASLVDYVDDYLFDGIYILLGEDGTVITSEGKPVLQYVWGKFWVNNHAHVISGKNDISIDFIYLILKNIDVSGIVTGAVQMKINQKNLKSLKVGMPKNKEILIKYDELIKDNFNKMMNISEENNTLKSVRDILLPKLMSGEIRVPVDETEESLVQ